MKKKKLSEISPEIKKDYSKAIIFGNTELPGEGHLLQVVAIPANTKQRAHYHNAQTEIFYILEGECSIYINDTEHIAVPGDAFVCEPGDRHYLWNRTDKEFKLVVFKIDKPGEGDDTVWM
ncbi:cupin domain-containing protein [bacterium]|nr:cupin domain-containing protein [bacterium]